MPNTVYQNAKAIDAATGTTTQEFTMLMPSANGFSVHLVTTGTLTGATGWRVLASNAPPVDAQKTKPDTSVFDWVELTEVTALLTQPAGAATNQFVNVSDWRGQWLLVRWDSTGVSGTGNVSAALHANGNG